MAITVIDVRQSRLQRIISYILSQLSNGDTSGKYFHLGYEVVSLNGDTANKMGINVDDHKFLHMSGRKGIYINADDVLNALHNRSYDETKLRNKDESEEWLRLTAEKVAIAAIRFSLLKQDVDKMITFDLSEALNLEGETGPYIQYAYARASRILDKSEGGKPISQEDASSLQSQTEVGLIKKISKFDIFVEDAVKNLSPKTIARYAFDLAESFNAFYEKNPVLQEQDEGKKSAKLTLVKAFRNTTKEALCLLGIEALDRI